MEMDVCKACGVSFFYGDEGSARIAIKRVDETDGSYFYEHELICPECVNKLLGDEE